MRVYVAGPYSKGVVAENVREAIRWADHLLRCGFTPFVPHLTHLWELVSPKPYEEWLAYDFEWLVMCNAVLRLSGESPGADREVAEAERLGIPVFYTVTDLMVWRDSR